jgi:hypothetical protein
MLYIPSRHAITIPILKHVYNASAYASSALENDELATTWRTEFESDTRVVSIADTKFRGWNLFFNPLDRTIVVPRMEKMLGSYLLTTSGRYVPKGPSLTIREYGTLMMKAGSSLRYANWTLAPAFLSAAIYFCLR